MFQDDGSSSMTSFPLRFFSMNSLSPSLRTRSPYPWLERLKSEERGLCLINWMLNCASNVASENLKNTNIALEHITHLASSHGDTIQRIAAYFTEALADRTLKSWSGLHKALNLTRMNFIAEEVCVKRMFFETLPFMKVAFMLTNEAIVEAMVEEKIVHIIDLNVAESTQWITLLHALYSRPGGPPFLKITGIHQYKEVLDETARVLVDEAEKLDIPFQFNPVVSRLENLDIEKLCVKSGEALAVSSVLQLHSLLAFDGEVDKAGAHSTDSGSSSRQSTSVINNFLNSLWRLSPKVMIVTEQDSNHNGSTLMERIWDALYYYSALFDCLEAMMPRGSVKRFKIEKMLLGEEINNIIACEGVERKERHEKLEKWIQRFDMAGFGNVPFNYQGLSQARGLLDALGNDGVKIKEENGCALICWEDWPLYSVSVWTCQK